MLVEDLFPLRLYDLDVTRAVVEIPLAELPPGDEIALLPSREDHAIAGEMEEGVRRALATLTPREQTVIRARFGMDGEDPRTLREIGDEFGVQQERIRQIEAKALRKLRHPSRVRLNDAEAADLAEERARKEDRERAERDARWRARRWR